jgi:sigma-E factor negative regulatory protein RseB
VLVRIRLAVMLCAMCVAQQLWAQSEAQVYLDQMSRSFRELDYRGLFTYEFGDQIESLRIVHALRDGVEKERLQYLDGESREYFRDGHHLSCIHSGHEKLRLDGGMAGGPFARSAIELESVVEYYRLSVGSVTRVADRPAREITVEPNDPYRYGFRLYLDEQTSLLLKSLTVGPRGEILERFQFAEIEIGVAIDDAELALMPSHGSPIHHHVLEPVDVAQSSGVYGVPEPQWLPLGFVASARSSQRREAGMVQFTMYTDGFSSLTLILEEIAAAQVLPTDGRARQGATVAYTRQLTVDGQYYLLTVVGEVPLMTARKVARSVTIKKV